MLNTSRVYCDLNLAVGKSVDLRGDRHHYLAHVLRLAPGSVFNLFNGEGEFACRVLKVERHVSVVLCERALVSMSPSRLFIKLYVAVAKSKSMDFIMQKATELGVAQVQPVVAERSIAVAMGKRKLEHWRGIARSACEQCGRADMPEIVMPIRVGQLNAPEDMTAFVLDPDSRPVLTTALGVAPVSRVAALFGPEGGLTAAEVRAAAEKGFTPVSLGPRLMRVETAVTAAVSVLQACAGDFLVQ